MKYEMGGKSKHTHDKMRNTCKVLVGKLEDMRQFRRPRCKLGRMDFKNRM
jgi:hypothetical protein